MVDRRKCNKTVKEIEKKYPLKECASCNFNIDEDGTYYCQLVAKRGLVTKFHFYDEFFGNIIKA